jgi:hypothetical protein
MIVEHSEDERGNQKDGTKVAAEDVDRLKDEDRKGFGEVY